MSVDPLTPRPWKHQSSHPLNQILSDLNTGVQTRLKLKIFCAFYVSPSNIEPKNVNEALADSSVARIFIYGCPPINATGIYI